MPVVQKLNNILNFLSLYVKKKRQASFSIYKPFSRKGAKVLNLQEYPL